MNTLKRRRSFSNTLKCRRSFVNALKWQQSFAHTLKWRLSFSIGLVAHDVKGEFVAVLPVQHRVLGRHAAAAITPNLLPNLPPTTVKFAIEQQDPVRFFFRIRNSNAHVNGIECINIVARHSEIVHSAIHLGSVALHSPTNMNSRSVIFVRIAFHARMGGQKHMLGARVRMV